MRFFGSGNVDDKFRLVLNAVHNFFIATILKHDKEFLIASFVVFTTVPVPRLFDSIVSSFDNASVDTTYICKEDNQPQAVHLTNTFANPIAPEHHRFEESVCEWIHSCRILLFIF